MKIFVLLSIVKPRFQTNNSCLKPYLRMKYYSLTGFRTFFNKFGSRENVDNPNSCECYSAQTAYTISQIQDENDKSEKVCAN